VPEQYGRIFEVSKIGGQFEVRQLIQPVIDANGCLLECGRLGVPPANANLMPLVPALVRKCHSGRQALRQPFQQNVYCREPFRAATKCFSQSVVGKALPGIKIGPKSGTRRPCVEDGALSLALARRPTRLTNAPCGIARSTLAVSGPHYSNWRFRCGPLICFCSHGSLHFSFRAPPSAMPPSATATMPMTL
jgi:hypothetical protein